MAFDHLDLDGDLARYIESIRNKRFEADPTQRSAVLPEEKAMNTEKPKTKTKAKDEDGYHSSLPEVNLQIIEQPKPEPGVIEKFIRIVFKENLPLVMIWGGALTLAYFAVNSLVIGYAYNAAHGIVDSLGKTSLGFGNPLVFNTGPFVLVLLVALIALGVLLNQKWNKED